mgnify:FL=1|tara:strand:- start:8840 stop:9670 length:831 start_codon:yes stop_codon:yes gene_type:complete
MPYQELELNHNKKFEQILKDAYVDPKKEVEYPPVAISMGSTGGERDLPICVGTYGNFSFIQAPPKSRKTFLVSLMASAYISGTNKYAERMLGHSDDRVTIHYDTEQGEFHSQRVFSRIDKMSGGLETYKPYSLREYTPQDRLEFIDWHINRVDNLGLVIIDGIADLVNDVNDINASNELVQCLMKWTKELKIHIITVIHSNYNSMKPTGHLGSFLEKKTETQISVKVDEEDDGTTIVNCMRSRGQPFDKFSFRIKNGIPYIDKQIDLSGQEDYINL